MERSVECNREMSDSFASRILLQPRIGDDPLCNYGSHRAIRPILLQTFSLSLSLSLSRFREISILRLPPPPSP